MARATEFFEVDVQAERRLLDTTLFKAANNANKLNETRVENL